MFPDSVSLESDKSAWIPTDICELPILKYDEVQLFTQLLELLGKVECEVFYDVAMGLEQSAQGGLLSTIY